MIVYALYRPHSEHASKIESFIGDFRRQTGKEILTLNLDTREGASKARTWDVVRYPALVAVDERGQIMKLWEDEMLPLINEVSWYVRDESSFVK